MLHARTRNQARYLCAPPQWGVFIGMADMQSGDASQDKDKGMDKENAQVYLQCLNNVAAFAGIQWADLLN